MRFFLTIILLVFALPCFAANFVYKQKNIPYTDTGRGTPLVLIHAFPTNKLLWQEQVKGLQSYFRIITLDLWGFGEADAVDGQAITMADYAEAIKLLLDQLRIPSAIIGGESMGGYIALTFMTNYPHKVQGLILSNTQAIADTDLIKEKREKTAQEVLQQGPEKFLEQFSKAALSNQASAETRLTLQKILQTTSATAIAAALRGMALRVNSTAVLKGIRIPVLIITSTQDQLVNPEQSQQMHRLLPQSKLVVLANVGHLSSLESPELWNQAVVDYFQMRNGQPI